MSSEPRLEQGRMLGGRCLESARDGLCPCHPRECSGVSAPLTPAPEECSGCSLTVCPRAQGALGVLSVPVMPGDDQEAGVVSVLLCSSHPAAGSSRSLRARGSPALPRKAAAGFHQPAALGAAAGGPPAHPGAVRAKRAATPARGATEPAWAAPSASLSGTGRSGAAAAPSSLPTTPTHPPGVPGRTGRR